jgi:hypothetical protein
MIVYDLKCRKDHVFEAWFPDSAGFAEQVEGGKVACPVCGSRKVAKALMAPAVLKGSSRRAPEEARAGGEAAPQGAEGQSRSTAAYADMEHAGQLRRKLRDLRDHVESSCEYVGERFAEEARKIHYGECDARAIYGETSDTEAEALHDEGIEIARVPWLPRDDS